MLEWLMIGLRTLAYGGWLLCAILNRKNGMLRSERDSLHKYREIVYDGWKQAEKNALCNGKVIGILENALKKKNEGMKFYLESLKDTEKENKELRKEKSMLEHALKKKNEDMKFYLESLKDAEKEKKELRKEKSMLEHALDNQKEFEELTMGAAGPFDQGKDGYDPRPVDSIQTEGQRDREEDAGGTASAPTRTVEC